MAVMDTGLGWEADENYLKQYAGKIGSINEVATPGDLIPVATTPSDIVARGLYVCTTTRTSTGLVYEYYIGADTAGCRACWIDNANPTSAGVMYLSVNNSAHVYLVRYIPSTGESYQIYRDTVSRTDNGLPAGCYYYKRASGIVTTGDPLTDLALTSYADNATAFAACTLHTEDITKNADGFCVVCWVNYEYNVNGATRSTPILFSSVPAYQQLRETHTGYMDSMINYEGMPFYYTIPTDIDTGTPFAIMTVNLTGTGAYTPVELFHAICRIASVHVTGGSTNPYTDPDSSEAGGGGTDPTDDEVPLEPVTFPSALGTGFCRIYCPSASDLQALSDYLWGPLFDLNNVKRLFADPMDSILGLSVVPLLISGTPETVSVAGISTGISLPKLSNQHIPVDLGSLQVTEKWGAYLDYEPYTKYSIYLPFIGYRTVSADDIMGKWVHLTYDIDLLSGACVAKLVSGSTLLYQWAGTCAMQLPVNAGNWNSVIQSTIATIGSVATGIASGGAAAPMVAGALSSAAVQATQMKPNIERAGGLSGAAAFLSGRRAYMIRTYPNMVNPGNQQHYIGYPSFITKQLGNVTGYNVVEDIHLEGIPATQTELEEIDTLLHEGVIL